MTRKLTISRVEPTVCLREAGGRLRQLVRVTVQNSGAPLGAGLTAAGPGVTGSADLGQIPSGESVHELFLDELASPASVEFVLQAGGSEVDRLALPWQPPTRFTVHTVQRSHHDVGYTDLPSQVLLEMPRSLDATLDMAAATDDYPEDARFRITIEQVWSLWQFLQTASPGRREKMLELLRSGRFEMTAFFGNMAPELCGSETLARALYHAARLKRQYGLPLLTAEHNDVPGLSWGQAQVLLDAGVKLFCPGLPNYWAWARDLDLQGFWDEATLFPQGTPGAFWWEAPSGGRLLLWHSGSGACGASQGDLPGLAESLAELAAQGCPFSVLRWPCIGGGRDNSPYIPDYAHTVKQWNETWAYPHLVCSTNARFYADLEPRLPVGLPTFRGELPGQDYPSGATSTAAANGVNRNTHATLPAAEKLAAAASCLTDYPYQADSLFTAYEDVLWHDEHTWGHTRPCSPANLASELEKATHAYRAAALAHDVSCKAMAQIADSVALEGEGFHLCVFNAEQDARTGLVRVPLREMDSASSSMRWIPPEEGTGAGWWQGVSLLTRGHAVPPPELVAGNFELLDLTTGEVVPHQILDLTGPRDTVPFAAQRTGVGAGGRTCGVLDLPTGLSRDLCFTARDVPGCGYRMYRMIPTPEPPSPRGHARAEGAVVENEFYRVEADPEAGTIRSLYDKAAGRELVDPACPHGWGALVVTDPLAEGECGIEGAQVQVDRPGPGCASLLVTGSAYGHPQVAQTVTLYDGLPEVHFAARLLKDSTPLLEVSLAFPFAAERPEWRYEANFSVIDPARDFLPGAYWDRLTVQNWVRVTDGNYHLLWSSLDAPIVSLANLWPDYLSPAHRCYVDERLKHAPVSPEALSAHGWIYSNVAQNNFGTNFSCVQVADLLFRYVLTTRSGPLTDAQTALWARRAVSPMTTIYTEGPRPGPLPVSAGFVQVPTEEVVLLAGKRAEDGRGLILRLWNLAERAVSAPVRFPLTEIAEVYPTNLIEEDQGPALPSSAHEFSVEIAARAVATIRVIPVEAQS